QRPTANTVMGTPSRAAAPRICSVKAGSPEPWKVRATSLRSRGPKYTTAAGPDTVGARVGDAAVLVVRRAAALRAEREQAARAAAAAATKKDRRERGPTRVGGERGRPCRPTRPTSAWWWGGGAGARP